MTRRHPHRPMLVRWASDSRGVSRVVVEPLDQSSTPHRRPGRPLLRDAATLCLDALPIVPGTRLVCELDAGHLDQGQKHKSGCTRWGVPKEVTDAAG